MTDPTSPATQVTAPMRSVSGRSMALRLGRPTACVAVAICVWITAACGSSEPAASAPAMEDNDTLRIASFDFAESELLAELYAQVAEASDIPVTRLGPVGPREILSPALESGAIDLLPEYLGTALNFAGNDQPPSDPATAAALLGTMVEERGLVVLEPAPAQDVNVFVVRTETSTDLGIVALSDLKAADLQRFGGPAECRDRPLCLRGLADTYGVSFEEFIPQRSLTFTAESLRRGEIDIGLLFSTSPVLDDPNLTVLRDDLGLQPPENLIPIMSSDAFDRWGSAFPTELSVVLRQLTTTELRRLNRLVASGEEVSDVAASWLETHGIGTGGAS